MTNLAAELLVRRLRLNSVLSDDDAAAIHSLPFHLKDIPARTAISREHDRTTQCSLIVSGLACRAKVADDGSRQLLSFHIAGDIPDLQSLHLAVMDHDLIALSAAKVATIAHSDLRRLTREWPDIAAAQYAKGLPY